MGSFASNSLFGFEISDGIPRHTLITESSNPGKAHVCVPCSLGMGTLFFLIILYLNSFILPYYSLPLFLFLPHYSFPLSRAICSRLSLRCVSTLIIVGSSASNSLLGFEINDGIPHHILITESSNPGKALQTGFIKTITYYSFFYACA